jgi:hypothetical protein
VKRVLTYILLLALLPALSAGCGGAPTPPPGPTATTLAATEMPQPEPTPSSPPASLAPPAEPSPAPKPAGSFMRYENEDLNVRLEVPEEWEISERLTQNTVLFVTPATPIEGEFRSNVSIAVQVLASPQTSLQAYTEAFLAQAPNLLTDFRLLASEPVILAGRPAQRVVYAATQNGLALQWLQVWALEGDRAYIVTYTAEESRFDQFLTEIHYIISTIEVQSGQEANPEA